MILSAIPAPIRNQDYSCKLAAKEYRYFLPHTLPKDHGIKITSYLEILTLSGSKLTLTAKGDNPSSLSCNKCGMSATQTALATPSAARAGSGGSPDKYEI